MKRLWLIGCLILLTSGCSLVYVNEQPIEEIVNTILVDSGTKLKSNSFDGYSYFLPQGVNLHMNDAGNSILYYNHQKMYLYVDIVSYYHHVDSDYQENANSYYSLAINQNGNKGYLEITEISNRYFIEFMYHYSKIEAYVSKSDLEKTVTTMAYILNSIQFQDSVLESLIGNNLLNYSEEQFNIFKPNSSSNNFLDYIEQYDDGRNSSKNEDIFELEDSIE